MPGTLLVRPPSSRLAEGQITHIERTDNISHAAAIEQWKRYTGVFASRGWKIIEVPLADELPDSVFIEDTVVMFGTNAVIASPGHESRAKEPVEVERVIAEALPHVTINKIQSPGTLDGGDVLKVGNDVYVGRGGRTNAEGIRQLREIIRPLGYTLHPIPVTKALHLKSAVTALPDGTIIGYEPIVDDPRIFPRFMPVPEPHGVAVVVLDAGSVVMSSGAPKTTELLRSLGYDVTTVDIADFEALEGCVTCLSVRVRD